jgi:hypothetical protein
MDDNIDQTLLKSETALNNTRHVFLMIILYMFESDTQIKLLIIPHQLTHFAQTHSLLY